MKIEIAMICRGESNAYIELNTTKGTESSELSYLVKSEKDIELPFEQFVIHSSGLEDNTVIVTPTLSTKTISIIVEEIDSNGSIIDSKSKTIDRNIIKIASKASYFLPFFDPYRIRGIEKRPPLKYIMIEPTFCASYTNEEPLYLIKLRLISPAADKALEVNVLDSSGNRIMELSRTVECHQRKKDEGITSLAEMTYRLPANSSPYCITAKGQESNMTGFLGLDGRYLNLLQSSLNIPYFKMASPMFYGQILEKSKIEESSAPRNEFVDMEHPLFSIVVPLYKTPSKLLNELVDSVIGQTYSNWELLLVNASPEDGILANELEKIADPRVKIITLESNEGISENTNKGILASSGSYVAFLDHDDMLSPIALSEYAAAVSEDLGVAAIYSDEDLISEKGYYCNPQFKSDFNFDLLHCHNYITHFLAIRSDYAKQLLLRKEFDGAQDYDLLLRLIEIDRNIKHVPKVLYHWRMTKESTASSSANKTYAVENGRLALQDHLNRMQVPATAKHTHAPCFYHVEYELLSTPFVSIIIPNKDSSKVLNNCVRSIIDRTSYRNFEIIIVENNSIEADTFELYEALESEFKNVRMLRWEEEFNYSSVNNFAAKEANGEYLVFLNNDTEVISENWLDSMLSLCQREDVGAVGAKLLFPDNTIQHAGVAVRSFANPDEINGPFHVFQHLDVDAISYARRAELTQDVVAVTAACMMTKKSVFLNAGGFDPNFKIAYNDIDYCFKLRDLGYQIVYDPYAVLYHYESLSRGDDTKASGHENYSRFFSEQSLLCYKWPDYFIKDDPYFGKYAGL